MATPDSDALKKGEKLGRAIATPVARYVRAADITSNVVVPNLGTFVFSPAGPVPVTPFFHIQAEAKAKRFGLVVGTTPVSTTGVVLHVYKNSTEILAQNFAGWSPLAINVLSGPSTPFVPGDVLAVSIDNPNLLLLPAVMLFIELDLG